MAVRVPMYTPRIPIRGGGGVIDLSAKENQSQRLVAQALGQIVGGIARKPQQEQVRGIVVRGEKSILLINPEDGSLIKDLGPPPKGEKANAALDAIVAMGKISSTMEEDIPEDILPSGLGRAALGAERQKLTGALGLEEYEQKIPSEKRSRFGLDFLAKDVPARTEKRYRKKFEGDYDYEAARKAGVGPDAAGHWPSKFKTDTSPERYVDGLDTKTASLKDVINTYTELARQQLGTKATPEQIVKKAKAMAKAKGWKIE